MTLFHFIPAEFALENLKQRRMKIAQVSDLNDPFELVAVDQSERNQRKIWANWKNAQTARWGMLCFSRTWRNPVLWSHYADKHRGMCLGFTVKKELHMPVHYRKQRLRIDVEELYRQGKLDKALMSKLMCTKFLDWKYEREVRVFAELKIKDAKSGLFFTDFGPNLKLTTIIAGPLCTVSESDIRKAIQEPERSATLIKSRLGFQTFDVVENKRGFQT